MRSPPTRLVAGGQPVRINVPWSADRLVCDNPTPNVVLVRFGGDSTPTRQNADLIIPAASSRLWPVSGADFVAAFDGSAAISADASSGLADSATIQVLSRDEPSAQAQSLSFLNLSLSQAASGGPAASGTLGPFDLSTWGGLVLSGHPVTNAWDQHGWAAYETSPDGVAWAARGRFPLWPGLELAAQLPRLERYGRIVWQPYGAPWAAAPTFALIARPTLAEIIAVDVTLTGVRPRWAWAAAPAGPYYVPGDLVEALDFAVENTAAPGNTGHVSVSSSVLLGAPAWTPVPTLLGLTGPSVRQFRLNDPLPINNFAVGADIGAPLGFWSALPRLRGSGNNVWGSPLDAPGDPTHQGFLRNVSDVAGTIADAAGALTHEGQLRQLVTQTAAAAGIVTLAGAVVGAGPVWTTTGIDLPAAQRIRSVTVASNAAAGTQVQVAVGTAGAMVAAFMLAVAPTGALTVPFPGGINYGANTRVWVWAALAGVNVSAAVVTW